mmetsp:Transcript_15661/g.44669  ORF Transcript_15661/g.44669 Transcript_15661/m.44669 type:complete len:282 (-) Transcript_15661:16051-16896(-)
MLDRREPPVGRRQLYLLPVLVGAGHEANARSVEPVEPRQHIGGDRRVRAAHVRRRVHVVEGRGDGEFLGDGCPGGPRRHRCPSPRLRGPHVCEDAYLAAEGLMEVPDARYKVQPRGANCRRHHLVQHSSRRRQWSRFSGQNTQLFILTTQDHLRSGVTTSSIVTALPDRGGLYGLLSTVSSSTFGTRYFLPPSSIGRPVWAACCTLVNLSTVRSNSDLFSHRSLFLICTGQTPNTLRSNLRTWAMLIFLDSGSPWTFSISYAGMTHFGRYTECSKRCFAFR